MSGRLIWEAIYKRFDPYSSIVEQAEGSPDVEALCDLFRRSTADLSAADSIPDDLLRKVAHYAGGSARDFVKLIRQLAEQGWIEDEDRITAPLVDRVLDQARRLMESGLDRGHIALLAQVAADPAHPLRVEDRTTRELLDYGKLLTDAGRPERHSPHPLLMMRLVRPGSLALRD
jgi:hypothetical protein